MAGQVSLRLVTFDFWQTLLADTPEGSAAAHALRLSGVGEALRRAGFGYDPAALEAADLRALARLREIWALIVYSSVTPRFVLYHRLSGLSVTIVRFPLDPASAGVYALS